MTGKNGLSNSCLQRGVKNTFLIILKHLGAWEVHGAWQIIQVKPAPFGDFIGLSDFRFAFEVFGHHADGNEMDEGPYIYEQTIELLKHLKLSLLHEDFTPNFPCSYEWNQGSEEIFKTLSFFLKELFKINDNNIGKETEFQAHNNYCKIALSEEELQEMFEDIKNELFPPEPFEGYI